MASSLPFSGVYAILHTPTSRRYVGQAVDIGLRWAVHRANLRKGNHHCKFLQNCWNKYPSDQFIWLVLERGEASELDGLEQKYIDYCDPKLLMNSQLIAGSCRGFKVAEETKVKMREAAKRVAADPEERKRRSERAKAQHAAKKLGAHTWTEESRAKVSEASKAGNGIKIAQEAAKAGQTSEEMSRRSYLRKMFE